MKTFSLKLGVVQRYKVGFVIYWFSAIGGFGLSQAQDSENLSNRNRASLFKQQVRIGLNLVAGAIPLSLTQQYASAPMPVQNPGITENFVKINQNRGRVLHNNSPTSDIGIPTGHLEVLSQHLSIKMGLDPTKNESVTYIRVSNTGTEDEFIQMTVLDSKGHPMRIIPSQFPLGVGATAEIPLTISTLERQPQLHARLSSSSSGSGREGEEIVPQQHSKMITVMARGKRDSVQRSFVFGDPHDQEHYDVGPFCIDKDVKGTCRYRDDPVDCFRWEWTAYATILNNYGPNQKITSLPEGLHLSPGEHGRVRVYLTVSCCTPVIQFISTDINYNTAIKSCVVDVRELQNLHPGEIAGIAIGALLLLIILIAIIIICARRRRKETINNVAMIPRLRSRTRSKEVITRQL